MPKYLKIIIFFLSALILLGLFYMAFHCKWKWSDLQFEKTTSAMIEKIDVVRPTPGWRNNLMEKNFPIQEKAVMDTILQMMKNNYRSQHEHTVPIWTVFLNFWFVDGSSLSMDVIQSSNQGCVMTFCNKCFGIKYVVRNDPFGKYLESLVGYDGPYK